MNQERFAQTGILLRDGRGLVLVFGAGRELEMSAWPEAGRHVDRRVHVVGTLVQGSKLVAASIAPLDE